MLTKVYSLPEIILAMKWTRIRWAGYVEYMRICNAYTILARKPKWNRLSQRSKQVWGDNIKIDDEETRVWGYGLNSVGSWYCPVAGSCMQGNESLNVTRGYNFLTMWMTVYHRGFCSMQWVE